MIVVVETRAGQLDELVEAIHAEQPERWRTAAYDSVERAVERLRADPAVNVLVIGRGLGLADALSLVESARAQRHVGVVLVREDVDQESLSAAIRSGIEGVVRLDDGPELAAAVVRARVAAQRFDAAARAAAGGSAEQRTARTTTVFATKGGVGKTTTATNLAVLMAESGRRTCLVDLDLQGGDVCLMLQQHPELTMVDLGRVTGALDQDAVRSIVTHHSDNLDVLAAPLRPGAVVPLPMIEAAIGILRGMYDELVIDTSGVFDDVGVLALDGCDAVVLVASLDLPSLKSLKLASGTLDLLNVPRDIRRLVVNRVDKAAGLEVREFEEAASCVASARISTDAAVLASVNRGRPIASTQPRHPATRALRGLIAELPGPADAPAGPGEDSSSEGKPGRWSRRRAQRSEKS